MTATRPAPARILGLVVVLALAGAGGYAAWQGRGGGGEAPDALTLYGNVDVRQVTLAFRIGGRIAEVTAEEGDRVAAGRVVARLETGDLDDRLTLAQARVESAAAELAALEAGSRAEVIEQTRAALAEAEASLKLARATRDRQAELAERDIASHQAHEIAQAAYEQAFAARDAARAALELARAGARSEDILRGRAALAAERAQLSVARRARADAELAAPDAGTVLSRIREPGSIVGPGEPVMTLSILAPVWVRSYVEEPDLGRIAPGMPVEVRTDSGGAYDGQIGFISPVAEFTPKSVETSELRTSLVYRLRVIVAAPDEGLRQGMPVTLRVPLRTDGDGSPG